MVNGTLRKTCHTFGIPMQLVTSGIAPLSTRNLTDLESDRSSPALAVVDKL